MAVGYKFVFLSRDGFVAHLDRTTVRYFGIFFGVVHIEKCNPLGRAYLNGIKNKISQKLQHQKIVFCEESLDSFVNSLPCSNMPEKPIETPSEALAWFWGLSKLV